LNGGAELPSTPASGVTAIVTAYQRVQQTVDTLERLRACVPPPAEISVHVDGNQVACEEAIKSACPTVRVLNSRECIGPGGGRNRLIQTSTNELVASFDDDSYPIDRDYFARVEAIANSFPDAAIINGIAYHQNEPIKDDEPTAEWVSDFNGGACVYRKSVFVKTAGYVPLPVAYGMEEVDLSLRLHSLGARVLKTPFLRVFHDTDLKRHADPRVTAGSIANIALLAYLRYPPSLWHIGAAQCLSRIAWLLRHGRRRGIVRGLAMIPQHVRKYRMYRNPVDRKSVRSYISLRRHPIHAKLIFNGLHEHAPCAIQSIVN
jgi:GT2 family glycosyltransferase